MLRARSLIIRSLLGLIWRRNRNLRLVDLDNITCTGKSLIEKALKGHELKEISFPCTEWDCVIVRDGEQCRVEMRKKGK